MTSTHSVTIVSGDNCLEGNFGNKPTFLNVVRREVIDITVASPDMAALIREWIISSPVTLSDRKRIDFVMDMDSPFQNP